MSKHIKVLHFIAMNKAQKTLFSVSLMIFFFVIFDGMLMYLAPILMSKRGINEGAIGLILGLSSVAGMFFDVLLSRLIRPVTYRTIFFVMLLVASAYPFFLFGATTVTMYLVAMVVWGLYYNLYNIGTLDFVGRMKEEEKHATSFGILKVFDGLGYLIAPFLGSLLLIAFSSSHFMPSYLLALLVPSYLLYIFIVFSTARKGNGHMPHFTSTTSSLVTKKEFRLWEKVGSSLFPVLLLTLIINLIDSAVWTIGPLFSESLGGASFMKGSFFMLAYTLPPLLVGWFVGTCVRHFGKKDTAIITLGIGSLCLSLVGLITFVPLLLCIIFGASFCFSLAWPSINAIYAKDIAEDASAHEEIESVEDLFTNIGDVFGPIIAGYSSLYFGHAYTFLCIGLFGFFTSLVLFIATPKKLLVRRK